MSQIEVYFTYSNDNKTPCEEWVLDLLSAQLSELGFDTFAIDVETNSVKAYTSLTDLLESRGVYHLEAYPVLFDYIKRVLPDINWNENWEQKGFQPTQIGSRLYVRAPRHESNRAVEHEVLIEPQQSFGAGSHHTTSMVLEFLSTMSLTNSSVLDMGCGTGVLGISAKLMGASRVTMIDIDQAAVNNTRHNLTLNHLEDDISVQVKCGGFDLLTEKGAYNVVVANIHRNILIDSMPIFQSILSDSGALIVSGFLDDDVELLVQAARQHQFELVDKKESEQWVAIRFGHN